MACHLGVLANLPTIGIGKNVSYNFFNLYFFFLLEYISGVGTSIYHHTLENLRCTCIYKYTYVKMYFSYDHVSWSTQWIMYFVFISNSTMFQLHHVDGLTQSTVRQLLETKGNLGEDIITLRGDSGRTWGAVRDLM